MSGIELLEKPAREIGITVKKYLAVTVLILLGGMLLFVGIAECHRYRDILSNSVTVTGKITDIKTKRDSDNGNRYYAYMTFTYEGKEYTVLYKTSGKKSSLPGIWDKVELKINPRKPGEEITSVRYGSFVPGGFGVAFMMLGVALIRIRDRKTFVESFGFSEEAVRRDVLRKIRSSWMGQFFLTTGIGMIALMLYMPDATPIVYWLAISICLIGIGCFILRDFWEKLTFVRNNKIRINTHTMIDKKTSTDKEGNPAYYLLFSDENRETSEEAVSKETFHNAEKGDQYVRVFLGDRFIPIIIYAKLGNQPFTTGRL